MFRRRAGRIILTSVDFHCAGVGFLGSSSVIRMTSEPVTRLNDFQQIMLYWNEVWPFQVVDVVEVCGAIDAEALRAAAAAELERMHAVGPVLDAGRSVCTFRGGPANVEVCVVEAIVGSTHDQRLQRQVVAELARRFTLQHDELIRLWILPPADGASGDDTTVGMTWQHWFADGLTAADLLRRILRRVLSPTSDEGPSLTNIASPEKNPFEDYGFADFCRAAVNVLRVMSTSLTVDSDAPEFAGTLAADPLLVAQPAECLTRLRRLSKAWGVTINDLVCTALMRALQATSAAMPGDQALRTRVGNIVDLRPFGDATLNDRAGQFLALMLLDAPYAPKATWRELASLVHRRSQYLKESKLFMSTLGAFRSGRRILAAMPKSLLPSAIEVSMRLSATITNLRLPAAWSEAVWMSQVSGYRRFLPPNLCSPVVLGLTTKGTELTMTFTIRRGAACEKTLRPAFEAALQSLLSEAPMHADVTHGARR